MNLVEFFETLTDIELVLLIADARKQNDKEVLEVALKELGKREAKRNKVNE